MSVANLSTNLAAGIQQTEDMRGSAPSADDAPARKYNPVEAAYAVAAYLPADPETWLKACARAGMEVGLGVYRDRSGEHVGLMILYGDADQEQITFLNSWRNLTPNGTEVVTAFLREKAEASKAGPSAYVTRFADCQIMEPAPKCS